MFSKAINLILIVLLSSALTNGVRRKSKIDLPIQNAADAPLSDNIALASDGQQIQIQKADEQSSLSNAATDKPSNASALTDTSAANIENEPIECDPDMIGFEIITG